LFVGDIPKTRNAKVMRRIVRAAYLGENLGDTSGLENPASLDEIKLAMERRQLPGMLADYWPRSCQSN